MKNNQSYLFLFAAVMFFVAAAVGSFLGSTPLFSNIAFIGVGITLVVMAFRVKDVE